MIKRNIEYILSALGIRRAILGRSALASSPRAQHISLNNKICTGIPWFLAFSSDATSLVEYTVRYGKPLADSASALLLCNI